jgi:hypothetical protein
MVLFFSKDKNSNKIETVQYFTGPYSGSRSALKSKFRSFRGKMAAWGLKMAVWRVCRSVVADSHHLDHEEQDLDPH